MTTKIIDNNRLKLADAILEAAPKFKKIAIATGYWDLPGFQLLKDALASYESVRILIGQEPLPPAYAKALDLENLDETFPEAQMKASLAGLEQKVELREAAKTLKSWIAEERVEVKIYRGAFLHAKAYILGDGKNGDAVGIIGSSNFTAAGLTRNLELNSLEDDMHKVVFPAQNEAQPHSHLSWFNSLWDDAKSENWNGKFTEILEASPMGDLTFSQYHMYIKALYEIYGDELVSETSLEGELEEILYSFQLRNAKLLLKKLEKNGVAILADSVGLGKTITAGAVLKTYIEEKGAGRIYVIAPASLTSQWKTELAEAFKLFNGFEVLSLQDALKIQQAREIDKYAPVDLFIVDEAHNLRSGTGSRFDELLDWFSENPESHVLLLTATPINNSLKDLKNQIQLAAKGKLHSFNVIYPTQAGVDVIDFYEAIDRLNAEIKRAIKGGKQPDYDKVNNVMKQGLRNIMVRTTRKGIEKEFGGVTTHDGTVLKFPKSTVLPTKYTFSPKNLISLRQIVASNKPACENQNVGLLDIDWLLSLTQRAEHPLDTVVGSSKAFGKEEAQTPFEVIFKVLLLLGFAPYKPDVYKHKYFRKDADAIGSIASTQTEKFLVSSQLSIHNMLRVTFLKRLESSQFALRASLENYRNRINQFESLLAQGKIARVRDLNAILDVFDDTFNSDGEDPNVFDGFDVVDANETEYTLEDLQRALKRDLLLIDVLIEMCKVLEKTDDKLIALANLIESLKSGSDSGNKLLVFSYYADTISYLKTALAGKISDKDFISKSGFTSGCTKAQINDLAKRFSPVSKKANQKLLDEGELQFLFSTDVLSEGQNLQDCGVIVNFDLHWNPVRMIQRNGRINRLGSQWPTVKIFNMHPEEDLNAYLTLVERLHAKIDQIKFAIGTDQSILGEEENPLEFVDLYDAEKASNRLEELDDEDDFLTEDEFVSDLRKFDAESTPADKELVRSIGLGKWGYLPTHSLSLIKNASALVLVSIRGALEHSGQTFKNHIFVRKGDNYGPVETFKALSVLRVSPDKTSRQRDVLSIDRDEIAKRSKLVAKARSKNVATYFRFTPSVNKALDSIAIQMPSLHFAQAVRKIHTKPAEKRAKSLIKLVNLESSQGGISDGTAVELRAFVDFMDKFITPKVVLDEDSIQGVLYFAQ